MPKKQHNHIPPILFDKTQTIIAQIEKRLKVPLLCYWNSTHGEVCDHDINVLYEILQDLGKQDNVALFIKSDGGNGQASLRIVNLLRQYFKKITILIPLECASAATMIAIGGDEIQMGPLAHLTAVDTSITHELSPLDRNNKKVSVSLDELNRTVRLWKSEASDNSKNPYEALFQYIHPLVIGAVDRSEFLSLKLCKEILSYHMDDEDKIDLIMKSMNTYWISIKYTLRWHKMR